MALTKEQLAEAKTFFAEEESPKQKADKALRAKIKAAAHKTSTHAHYVVGPQGAYSQGVLYKPGEVIKLPLDREPSVTFRPASSKGIAAAERAAALKADETAELVAELDTAPVLEDDAAKGKGKKSGRASDTDVA
jgi:hypothetical protein